MASTTLVPSFSLRQASYAAPAAHAAVRPVPVMRSAAVPTRRQLAVLLPATAAALVLRDRPARAEDIGLFGFRKKLRGAEQEAEEIVREGFEAAEKGLETAEKGIVAAERGIKAAERGIEEAEKEVETAVSFGALSQAAAVAGAEVVGVVVATAVVNGILGPEGQRT
ncbi:uncharacterized protein LOC116201310 [Punica granatum]|uniref:Synechocystis YCF37-like n=2 Tax=Punica granatum TaxID=22663 RepID=A0A218W1C5_PUNGR|nr:uncharacterized protein LOC116201310 [Punica granatum]OWM66319.1 hypothetical protein CDL15_Pgr013536 [Punica granatum]PKI36163.1 hypothetical protein CRG98_043462 [Punica granatum]